MNKKEEVVDQFVMPSEDVLPEHHFTQSDLDKEWLIFINSLSKSNSVAFNAINNFKLSKSQENTIAVNFSSTTAKVEFDKVSGDFLNHFKHKVSNFKIHFEFFKDETLKKEILTKKKLFEKFAEINPILKDLDDLMKFDLS